MYKAAIICAKGNSIRAITKGDGLFMKSRNFCGEAALVTGRLAEKEGQAWKKIGEILGRTQTNVRDKWRSLGAGKNSFRKKGPWSLEEIYTLIKLVQQSSGIKLIRKEVEFRINSDEGKPELDEEEIPPFEKVDRQTVVMYKEISVEEFLSLIVRRKKLKTVPFYGIDWTPIANILKTRSYDDCRNEW